jgi:proteic killer suppression protein
MRSFRCKDSERLFPRETVRRFKASERQALRETGHVRRGPGYPHTLDTSGEQTGSLEGDQKGQYSIRINEQWRICIVWLQGHTYDVEIVDRR